MGGVATLIVFQTRKAPITMMMSNTSTA